MKYTSEFTAAEIDSKLKEISAIKRNLSEVEEYLTALQTALENKVEKVEGKELSSNDFTDEYKTKVDGLENYDDTAIKSDIEELQTGKVDKETGKSLSTNDFTTAEKEKLEGIETGANKTVVDSTLSSTSTNPVQNKVINTALGNKANSADVYDKGTSDSRFLGINGTAVKAVADGTGANIAEQFTNLQKQIEENTNNISALNTAIYLYNVTIGGEIVEFTEGYVMRIGNQVHINCKLIFLKDYNHKYWTLFHLPFAVKTPDEVRYRIDCIQEDSTTKWIYVDNKSSAFACGDVMFVKGDTIEVKNLILDMYVE